MKNPEKEKGKTGREKEEAIIADWSHGFSGARTRRFVLALVQIFVATIVITLSVEGAYLMVYGWPNTFPEEPSLVPGLFLLLATPAFNPFLPALLLAVFIYLFLFWRAGIFRYPADVIVPFGKLFAILKGAVLGGCFLLLILNATRYSRGDKVEMLLITGYTVTIVFLGELLGHSGILLVILAIRTLGRWKTRVVIIARQGEAEKFKRLFALPGSEYLLVGVVQPRHQAEPGLGYLGGIDDLADIINRFYLDEIILATDSEHLSHRLRSKMLRACWRLGVDLKIEAPFAPYFITTGEREQCGDTWLLSTERVGLYGTWGQVLKRAMDIVISIIALILFSPILLLTAIAIKLDSPGPVLFFQERPGLHGRVFRIIKFRSMRTDADQNAHREAQRKLIREGKATAVDKDGKPIYGKVGNDPRITRVGKFIRRTSIDELPQLINVLKGEMSLVGPRPSVLYELENYTDRHMRRLSIRPGITGLWQVSGRSRLSFEQMVDLDIQYIQEWSIWLDIKILLKTIPVVLNIDHAF